MSEPIHRDDLPMDLVESIQEQFSELHPGTKIIFAGDMDIPPEVLQKMQEMQDAMRIRLDNGQCLDCGAQMNNWPPPEDDETAWQPDTGWKHFTDHNEEICAWQCPACHAKDV